MSPSRPPPSNLDAEAAVLSSCLLKRDAVDVVADILRTEHFWSDPNRLIYGAVLELAAKGEPIDTMTVAALLRNQDRLHIVTVAYLAQIVDATPAVSHVETHARIVRDLWRLRQLIDTSHEIAAKGYGAVGDIQGFLDEAEAKVRAVTEPDRASSVIMLRDSITKVFGAMSASMNAGHRSAAVMTGLHKYDEATTGLHPGDLLVLAGRPGMGKTSCATAKCVNIAAALTTGPRGQAYLDHVALFELEMPHEQITTRMACSEASVEVQKVRAGTLSGEDMTKLTEACQFLAALPIHIDDTGGITPVAIRAKCRRIAAEAEANGGRLAAVVIDHIGIVNCRGMAGRNGSRSDEIGAATSFFKTMAKEMKLPIILLCQLNRAVERQTDKRPGLADLRDSGNIEQDADNVTFVFRPEYYIQAGKDVPDDIKGMAELIIAKQRNGPTGVIPVKFDGRYTRFENLSEAKW